MKYSLPVPCRWICISACLLALNVAPIGSGTAAPPDLKVGELPGDGAVLPTRQLLHPAGDSLQFSGRPVDLALSSDGKRLFVKDNRGLVVIDPIEWRILAEVPFPSGGASMHGIAVSRDGKRVWLTTAQNQLWEFSIGPSGSSTGRRSITLPGPKGSGDSHPCGIAISPDEKIAYVCLSINNSLGIVNLESGRLVSQIPTGVAPFDVVLSNDGATAFVSNWGGRRPDKGARTATSAGTPTLVDERGVASSGSVSVIDLALPNVSAEIDVDLHPSDLALSPDGAQLYVANANSDSVSVIDARVHRRTGSIMVRPDPKLLFGSAPNGVALSPDGRRLFVANGGNNAVAVVASGDPGKGTEVGRVEGFIPTGWYPGAIVADDRHLYVANVKGLGSRRKRSPKGFNSYDFLGTVNRIALPSNEALRRYTATVRADARVPCALRAWERSRSAAAPVPVPARLGEPSLFEHVLYVIKENRTYDQVFGDLARGNNESNLCIYPRIVTPNQHALAEEFVLLDNFYCNGVLSADGHSWATEGNVTDHLEKSFGGFTRSYTFGDDPLTYSSTGFLWDNALLHGLSFRNYGEMDYAEPIPGSASFRDIYRDFTSGKRAIRFKQLIGIEALRRQSAPGYPGWNLNIPDVLRADVFLKELADFDKRGEWPNLTLIYLPNDHTSGTGPGGPTPRAQVADNDLALGRIVEGISRSRSWPKTCIFVVEDDPQDGFDHVDGHRSTSLVVSPYSRRRALVSRFYNQTSVLHTMEQILGLPPMNQMDALAPLMDGWFTYRADLRPWSALPNTVPLDEMNPGLASLTGEARRWALASQSLPLRRPDQAPDALLNKILWFAARGPRAPYPASFAGAHGKGLKAAGLRLSKETDPDDD